jgi:hypothetical protein
MTGHSIASATAMLATAAIPASEIALSPEQIEAIGSWRLHIVLGAVAVIAMILSARMFRYALARIESITAMQARALSDLSEAIHRAALADQRLTDRIITSPCLNERLRSAPSNTTEAHGTQSPLGQF